MQCGVLKFSVTQCNVAISVHFLYNSVMFLTYFKGDIFFIVKWMDTTTVVGP